MNIKALCSVGFTLLELMIVFAVIAIIATFASPNLIYSYYHIKNECLIRKISQEIYLARSLAITSAQILQYCSDGSWRKRRKIVNRNGITLFTFNELPTGYELILKNSLHHNNCVTFTPLGFTLEQRGSFYLMSPVQTIRIIIGLSGNVHRES